MIFWKSHNLHTSTRRGQTEGKFAQDFNPTLELYFKEVPEG